MDLQILHPPSDNCNQHNSKLDRVWNGQEEHVERLDGIKFKKLQLCRNKTVLGLTVDDVFKIICCTGEDSIEHWLPRPEHNNMPVIVQL